MEAALRPAAPVTPSGEASGVLNSASPPSISLPEGGGAIRGMGEKFGANPVNGTWAMDVPLALSPGRSGFGPNLALHYDSGLGNGAFGLGWSLSLPAITRKTDKGLPRYLDDQESDVFILSGAEDLVPVLDEGGGAWHRQSEVRMLGGVLFNVQRYRPRIEGLFARIERWTSEADPGEIFWRSISRDNITTWYGRTVESRIADPFDPSRIFSWLVCETYDDKGDAALYRYKAEDSQGVDTGAAHEANRTPLSRSAGRYLKRILYGARTPRQPDEDLSQRSDWLLEAVFDYGEHYAQDGAGQPTAVWLDDQHQSWAMRDDPFSTYRAGFEVRSYRLCQRVLMFHHFEAELGAVDYLVKATELTFDQTPIAAFLTATTQSGFVWGAEGSYLKRSMPPLEFDYSQAVVDPQVRDVDPQSLQNLPDGGGSGGYRWLDLDGEGLQGVLCEQADGWYYKRNLSPLSFAFAGGQPVTTALFDPMVEVATLPSFAEASSARHQFLDLAGDGQLDCVVLDQPSPGFYERTEDEDWDAFQALRSLPNLDWADPNLRFVDLTGDGHADIAITEDGRLRWYPSLGERGFGDGVLSPRPDDEEAGPAVIFADSAQSIFLVDMSGDGLSDIVRIRNGEICYWPNLGYGQFGGKVAMDDAPWFEAPELFDVRRVRLADIDGSGPSDIVYLASDGVRLYFNQAGNGWSAARPLDSFPAIDDLGAIQMVDLLGNGTACLVWSSPLARDASRPMRYIDLIGGQKPHLLVKTVNNLGAETRVQYAPSAKFYLAAAAAGRPWVTRLPFPVHVVETIETLDRISRNRFVTRFAYHHGYYDGVEREFRGFAMVEQWDTEDLASLAGDQTLPQAGDTETSNWDAASNVAPILTRTWFHTGVADERQRISGLFAAEYYREPGLTDAEAARLLLDDTALPPGLTAEEEREACRALKGAMLRQEVYGLDGSAQATTPYSVGEQNLTLQLLQPRQGQRHAVFFVHPREVLTFHYERDAADPRLTHGLTLEVGNFGDVLKSATVAYPRRQPDPLLEPRDQAKQAQLHVTWSETDVTNATNLPDDWRGQLTCETRLYELTGVAPAVGEVRFMFDEILAGGLLAAAINYEDTPTPGTPQKRLLQQTRSLYRADDFSGALPLGQVEPLALPFESYRLVFTPGLIAQVYGSKVTDAMAVEGGYVHSQGDARWWAPSGRVFFSPSVLDNAASELNIALQHFFLPRRYVDAFGATTAVDYDACDLLAQVVRDALGNVSSVGERDASGAVISQGYDYRVLQPSLVTDANGNRAAVSFDALGAIVGAAVMGKRDETPRQGDLLDGFEPDLADATAAAHLADPLAAPQVILARATTRQVYDLHAYFRTKDDPQPQPCVIYTLARETHYSDLTPGQQTKVQHRFTYSDGFGREIQKKARVEPGPLADGGPTVDPRWVASGWTIFNNKGAPVRQFEPFFTATSAYESDVRVGVSPILIYDPLGRPVATVHPNHSWQKVVVGSWRQETWDGNDTVLIDDPTTDPDVRDAFRRLPQEDWSPTWYAQRQGGALGAIEQTTAAKTTLHAATPELGYSDSLGRLFLTVAHNRFERNGVTQDESYASRVELDIEGRQRHVIDALDRIVMAFDHDLVSTQIHRAGMDGGERWVFSGADGQPLYGWDSRGHRTRMTHDLLRRPQDVFLSAGGAPEQLVARTMYGESLPDAEARNARRQPVQTFDQSGVFTTDGFDFKGNMLLSHQQLAQDYKAVIDWSGAPVLEAETFASVSTFDALNRPATQTTPDGSIHHAAFNAAGLLEAVRVELGGPGSATVFVGNIDYDAKGQRTRIDYPNGVRTTYAYDPLTQRLVGLTTTRASDQAVLQDLAYSYDPAGDVCHIADAAQQTVYFNNQAVGADGDYTYDALHRLVRAEGREHVGQAGQPQTSWNDASRMRLPLPSDGQAMRRYVEQYAYDPVGGILSLAHQATNGDWTRAYLYAVPSRLELGKVSNRLSRTTVGTNPADTYDYDVHGSATAMPHLSLMRWDFNDRLSATARQVVNDGAPETTYYVYDATGQRVRKVTERQDGTRKESRAYLGGFELYRRYDAGGTGVVLERETLHVMDDRKRVALVETRTVGIEPDLAAQLIHYQFGNHLGSATLELDSAGQTVSYEEYYPYGGTSYQAGRSLTEVSLKRYRYTGMERDEESGFGYHTARYYAPWLGRWISPDPIGLGDGLNLYAYVSGNPPRLVDQSGMGGEDDILNALVTWSQSLGAEYRGTSASSVKLHDVLRTELPRDLQNNPRLITEAVIDKNGFVVREGLGPHTGGLPNADVRGTYQTIDTLVIDDNVSAKDVARIRNGTLSARGHVTPVDLKLGGAKMSNTASEGLEARLGSKPMLIGQDGRYHDTKASLRRIKAKMAEGKTESSEGDGESPRGDSGGGETTTSETSDPWDRPVTRGKGGGGGFEVSDLASPEFVRGAGTAVAVTALLSLLIKGELPDAKDLVAGLHPVGAMVQAKDHNGTVVPIILFVTGHAIMNFLKSGAVAAAPVAAEGGSVVFPVAAAAVGLAYGVPQAGARGISAHMLGAKGGWGNLLCYPGLPCAGKK
jgi:RHS repeat-associated protein